MQQTIATIATVDTSAVTISMTAASVQITANIAVPASTTAVAFQSLLSTSLFSAAAASEQLGITVEEVPTVELASPPTSPPLSPPSPATFFVSPSPPAGEDGEEDVALLPKAPDAKGGEDATMLALLGSGIVVAAVLAACYLVARKHRLEKNSLQSSKIGPTLTSDSNRSSEPNIQVNAAEPAPYQFSLYTVAYDIPYKGMLLDGSAQMRTGLSWYRPVKLQLIAAPDHAGGSDAPAWSALVIDGEPVPYDEVVSVRVVESALWLIVEQASHGQDDPPALKHLRMYSRSEFNLWGGALQPKVLNSNIESRTHTPSGMRLSDAGKWLADAEAEAELHYV